MKVASPGTVAVPLMVPKVLWSRFEQSTWVAAGLLSGFVFSFSTIVFALYKIDFLTVANESIAYRYFFLDRLAHHEPGDLFLGQGYLTLLMQKPIYELVAWIYAPSDLRSLLNGFGLLTLGLSGLVLTVVLVWACADSKLSRPGKLSVLFAGIVPMLGTGTAGFYYGYLPDYYRTDMVLTPIVVYCFLRTAGPTVKEHPWWVCLGAGGLVGLVASNKISVAPYAAIVLVPIIVRRLSRPLELLRSTATIATGALGAFATVHLLVYDFNLPMIVRVVHAWLRFVGSPGTEPGFWTGNFQLFLKQYNYLQILLLFFAVSLVAGMRLAWTARSANRTDWVVWLAILAAGAFVLWSVVKRPAGTTLFETAMMVIGLTAALLGWVAKDRFTRPVAVSVLGGLALLVVIRFDYRGSVETLTTSLVRTQSIWQIHDELVSYGKPVVLVIPDNSYGFGSVEEALLKGFADFPTWVITTGNAGINRLTPGISFRTEQGGISPSNSYPDGIVLAWFDRRDLVPLRTRYPALSQAASGSGAVCQTTGATDSIAVTICDLPGSR